jgi:type II secretory pathway component GspD/PulD (secretin)
MILLCVGCAGMDKSRNIFGVDVIDNMQFEVEKNDKSMIDSVMSPVSGRFDRAVVTGTSTAGVVDSKYKIELLDSMPVYDFFLAMLSPVSLNLVMDASIEANVSCSINSELSQAEIINTLSLFCRSVGLDFVLKDGVCTVSKQIPNSIVGKSVLVYQSKYIRNSQGLFDILKTFEGVLVINQGLITIVIAHMSDIELIKNILVSIDRDIFSGYVYSFIVCNDSKHYIESMRSILLGINSRYEEQIQIIKITDNVIMILSLSDVYLKQVEMLSSMIDTYVNRDLQLYSVKVRYRKIDDVVNYVKGVMGEVSINSDSEQNVVYFSGSRVQFERLRRLVSQYDVMPYQLLVRLYMIDIKSNDSLNAGSDWLVESGSFQLGQSELIYPLSGGINSMVSVGNIKAFFSFLEKRFDAKVVSRPYLYMKSGQSAKIQIGSEVPFVTSKTSQSTVSSGIVQNVEYRDVGMIFKLTSTVTDSQDIIMDVSVENSAMQSGAGVEDNPIFTSDNLETKFIVHDKSLTILGGIKFSDRKNSSKGFPFLSRIPVLKYIFGVVDRSFEGREMLIAICPKILDSISAKEFGNSVFRNISEYLENNLIGVNENGNSN